jgi:hypothetical protein
MWLDIIHVVKLSEWNDRDISKCAEDCDEDEDAGHRRRTIVIAIAAGMISQNIATNSHFGSGLLGAR